MLLTKQVYAHDTHLRRSGAWEEARLLVVFFCLWKLVILSIIILSPGIGYDTSSTHLIDVQPVDRGRIGEVATVLPRVLKFVRWDAIYFSQIAQRGYDFEQEWAFGPGFPSLVGFLSRYTPSSIFHHQVSEIAFLGAAVSNVFHLLSVLLLYRLSTTIYPQTFESGSTIPLITAALHIISPAGAFITAPYSEALFSFLNFLGYQLYFSSLRSRDRTVLRADIECLAAGTSFGLATTVRSNGLLSGTLFLYDAFATAKSLVTGQFSADRLRRLFAFCVGGCIVALGAIIPQYFVYAQYCILDAGVEKRPWCYDHLPSIYAWVQRRYWNVGLFRYWTFSNLPLFLLAAPTILILCQSSIWGWTGNLEKGSDCITDAPSSSESHINEAYVRRLAIPQVLLAIMALLSYHVQIITRLSSGYPLWYMWLTSKSATPDSTKPEAIVRWMVVYAIVQGTLFATFLPPA